MEKQLKSVLGNALQAGIESVFLSSTLKVEIENTKTEIEQRILQLTPETGWEGKNEAERKTHKDRVLASDLRLQHLQTTHDLMAGNKIRIDAQIDAISLKLRCLDLFVRDQANVLAGGLSAAVIEPEVLEEEVPEELDQATAELSKEEAPADIIEQVEADNAIIGDPLDTALPRPAPVDDLPF